LGKLVLHNAVRKARSFVKPGEEKRSTPTKLTEKGNAIRKLREKQIRKTEFTFSRDSGGELDRKVTNSTQSNFHECSWENA